MKKIHIKRFDTGEIVKSIEVQSDSPRHIEKVMRGMLRNMNTDDYYVDDSEFQDKKG